MFTPETEREKILLSFIREQFDFRMEDKNDRGAEFGLSGAEIDDCWSMLCSRIGAAMSNATENKPKKFKCIANCPELNGIFRCTFTQAELDDIENRDEYLCPVGNREELVEFDEHGG